MRILIGYDGSESSEAIFKDLADAGLPNDATVKVVTVADLLMSTPQLKHIAPKALAFSRVDTALATAVTHAEDVTGEARAFAEIGAERIRKQFPNWNVTAEVLTGTPDLELIAAAEDWDADLIIVGSQKRNAVGRFLLGSVSRSVVTGSNRSVRVSRPAGNNSAKPPTTVVVAIDGSEASKQAVLACGRRAWSGETDVRLVAVHDHVSPARIAARLPNAAALVTDHNAESILQKNRMIEWARRELNSIDLNVSISIQKGDAKRIILKEAQKSNAHTIFVGTRDFKDSFERFRLGSVSASIVANAACSVEVARSFDIPEAE
ncbi:MAG: universal stress protein [Acidobacteriota bacterium]